MVTVEVVTSEKVQLPHYWHAVTELFFIAQDFLLVKGFFAAAIIISP